MPATCFSYGGSSDNRLEMFGRPRTQTRGRCCRRLIGWLTNWLPVRVYLGVINIWLTRKDSTVWYLPRPTIASGLSGCGDGGGRGSRRLNQYDADGRPAVISAGDLRRLPACRVHISTWRVGSRYFVTCDTVRVIWYRWRTWKRLNGD